MNSDIALLRRRLMTVEETSRARVAGPTLAAVLVPLFVIGDELRAVFTERRKDLSSHAGEISFPGGRREPTDDTLLQTALREAQEEVGLARTQVQVIGGLEPVSTIVTGFAVHPYVGIVEPRTTWRSNPDEVDRVIELPLGALAEGFAQRRLERYGVPFETDTYVVGDELIWGATARILGSLLGRLDVTEAGD